MNIKEKFVHLFPFTSLKLSKLREIKSVDLIVTDLYMPGIDGWKLCRLLRSLEFAEFNKIPILVMSATFSGSDADL